MEMAKVSKMEFSTIMNSRQEVQCGSKQGIQKQTNWKDKIRLNSKKETKEEETKNEKW